MSKGANIANMVLEASILFVALGFERQSFSQNQILLSLTFTGIGLNLFSSFYGRRTRNLVREAWVEQAAIILLLGIFERFWGGYCLFQKKNSFIFSDDKALEIVFKFHVLGEEASREISGGGKFMKTSFCAVFPHGAKLAL